MTFERLKQFVNSLDREQLSMDVTIRINNEFVPAYGVMIAEEDDVLDANHPYLTVEL